MDKLKTDFIQNVISIMKNNEITEITLDNEKSCLYIKTNGYSSIIKKEEKIAEQEEIITSVDENVTENKKNLVPVVSSMIGLFFSKPSPSEQPFVKIGDKVKKGQTLCIVETIKLMNKITSEVSGIIKEICIEDGKPVEYGQTMMYIEQD